MMRCPNGQCSDNCDSAEKRTIDSCTDTGKVLCGRTMTCASTYEECTVEVYCPKSTSYSFSPSSFLCGDGPQVCVFDRGMCQSTACSSSYAFSQPDSTKMIPYANYDSLALQTCPDGRCMMNGLCMTAFQCSSGYLKAGGFGLFCVKSEAEADQAVEIAVRLSSQICPPGTVLCLNGQCRASVYDCPQETTCPPSLPFQCRDGQC